MPRCRAFIPNGYRGRRGLPFSHPSPASSLCAGVPPFSGHLSARTPVSVGGHRGRGHRGTSTCGDTAPSALLTLKAKASVPAKEPAHGRPVGRGVRRLTSEAAQGGTGQDPGSGGSTQLFPPLPGGPPLFSGASTTRPPPPALPEPVALACTGGGEPCGGWWGENERVGLHSLSVSLGSGITLTLREPHPILQTVKLRPSGGARIQSLHPPAQLPRGTRGGRAEPSGASFPRGPTPPRPGLPADREPICRTRVITARTGPRVPHAQGLGGWRRAHLCRSAGGVLSGSLSRNF